MRIVSTRGGERTTFAQCLYQRTLRFAAQRRAHRSLARSLEIDLDRAAILSNESRCDRRYQQAVARATENLSCNAAETVKSVLTRRTFYEPYTYDYDQHGTVEVSAPSARLIRNILDEAERLLRSRESDIIEQIKAEHDTHACQHNPE